MQPSSAYVRDASFCFGASRRTDVHARPGLLARAASPAQRPPYQLAMRYSCAVMLVPISF
eukprot:4230993-Pleurochrysis_carterae.AAC.3